MTYGNRSASTPSRASEDPSASGRFTETSHDQSGEAPPDLAVFVQDLLEQMQLRFSEMGDSITGKMDEMGRRMDELEQSINELMDQAGLEPPPEATTSDRLQVPNSNSADTNNNNRSENSETRAAF